MRLSRLLSTCALLVSVSACGGRYRTEHVGQGIAIVASRGVAISPDEGNAAPPWAVGGGIQLAEGSYDLALRFDVPRAQVIDWTVACPGAQVSGTAGEAFEQYRARRLAELRAQRERDRERTSAVTGAVVGAVAPTTAVRGQVMTPHGQVALQGEVRAPARLAGEAVAHAVIPDELELPPGDLGAGRITSRVRIDTTGPGVCAVTAVADDGNVVGSFAVTRVRDLHAEARLRAEAERSVAITARGRVKARLVAHGADPMVRQLRLQAEAEVAARVRAEAAARAQLRAQARAEVEAEARIEAQIKARAEAHARAEAARRQAEADARLRLVAISARAELRGRYLRNGADPGRRARLAEHQEAQQRAQQAALQARARAEARVVIDLQQQRLDLAERARMALRARFVAWGAIPRPPMPALLAEESGDPPFAGARWVPGTWVWVEGRWQWRPGGWTDPDVFMDAGGDVMVGYDLGGDLDLGVGQPEPTIRDHRRGRDRAIRDHRAGDASPAIRDHRRDTDDKKAEPAVRDHRSSRDEFPTSTIRDHRDDKKDDDDRGGNVRDHRRR